MIHVWADGSITGSHWAKKGQKDTPPHLWCGWVAKNLDGSIVHHHSLDMGDWPGGSANVAEYMGVRSALRWLALNHRKHGIWIHSDSQVVMNQLTGKYETHNETLRKWRDHVRRLASLFPVVNYKWIPREMNREADVLSKSWQTFGRIPRWEEVQAALGAFAIH